MTGPTPTTVTAVSPRVTVALSGANDVPLRPSALLENIAVGERLVVVQATNGGIYAIERESLYYAPPHDHPYAASLHDSAAHSDDYAPPHDHPYAAASHGDAAHSRNYDADFVNATGDTMIGSLNVDNGQRVRPRNTVSGVLYEAEYYVGTNGDLVMLLRKGGAILGPQFRQRASQGDTQVTGDFVVTGAKNAEIPDPDDPTVGYRFAAMEADEPGLLFKRIPVEITTADKVSKTVDLPPQWAKIAEKPDAMVTPVGGEGTTQHDTRAWPRAEVDIAVPNVTIYAPPGRYSIWVLACRKDASVQNWQHVVPIEQEETA